MTGGNMLGNHDNSDDDDLYLISIIMISISLPLLYCNDDISELGSQKKEFNQNLILEKQPKTLSSAACV